MPTERLGLTPSQTVGPYLHLGLQWPEGPLVVPEGTPGSFLIRGRVLDGNGEPVVDAVVESWQADPAGCFGDACTPELGHAAHADDPRRAPAGFRGFGRCETDGEGRYWLRTVKPAPLPARDGGTEAPHLNLSIFARGLLDRVVTRLYFPDESNEDDPVLRLVDPSRRPTLIARVVDGGYEFDIRLQGPGETVFFDV
jgi:protocatechuate 3,4-dioxygenase alpha subunit